MKKIVILLLALILTGCAGEVVINYDIEHTPEPAELTELKNEIEKSGKLIGVAYLGWLEGDMETACEDLTTLDYTKDFPFIKDIDNYAENEGYRMYMIVPADLNVSVSVFKCEFDDEYMPCAGEELVSANEPILIRGNISDTIPNLYVVAEKDSEKIEYTPVQSGMDGKLENGKELVYDFTPYDMLPEFSEYDEVPDAVFCGNWIAFENDGNGEERTLLLTINPDGTAEYVYGIGNSEVLEEFEGTWSLDENDILRLKLTGGIPESIDNPVIKEPYDCNTAFEWEITAEGLSLKHIDGDEILYGTSGNTFEFVMNE